MPCFPGIGCREVGGKYKYQWLRGSDLPGTVHGKMGKAHPMHRLTGRAAAIVVVALVASCGGDGGSAEVAVPPSPSGADPQTPSPSTSPAPTASPSPTATSSPEPSAAFSIAVGSVEQLKTALDTANARGGDTAILLADGVYTLSDTLYVNAPNVTIASQSGSRDAVVIQGDAMSASARVGNLIRVAGSGFRLSGLTLQRAGWHLIQIAGEEDADGAVIRDCVLRDSYEQMLKISRDEAAPTVTADGGLVENCVFEYSAGIGPQYYIGGIDAHGAKNWVIRANLFRDIASPNTDVAEFAIHFWSGSAGNVVERNVIVDCDRGIGFGMDGRGNQGGVIRNNFVHHTANADPYADVAIALADSPDTLVYNNTVLLENAFGWAIEYRFAATRDVLIVNNLSNRPILSRDGATGTVASNVANAERTMFRLQESGDLRLAGSIAAVVDQGQAVAGLVDDIDGQTRPRGGGYDIGADEL